jgi:hypothetical protein
MSQCDDICGIAHHAIGVTITPNQLQSSASRHCRGGHISGWPDFTKATVSPNCYKNYFGAETLLKRLTLEARDPPPAK